MHTAPPVSHSIKCCKNCRFWQNVEDEQIKEMLGLDGTWGRCTSPQATLKLSEKESTEEVSTVSRLISERFVYRQTILNSALYYSDARFLCVYYEGKS